MTNNMPCKQFLTDLQKNNMRPIEIELVTNTNVSLQHGC